MTYNPNIPADNSSLVASDIREQFRALKEDHIVLPKTGTGATDACAGNDYRLNPPCIHVRDQRASGTDGGTSSTGWNTRVLNTTITNTISGASLSSNQITLPAGTYRVYANAPTWAGSYATDINRIHKVRFRNMTDLVTVAVGSNEGFNYGTQTRSHIYGNRFTITASKTFQLQHYIYTAYNSKGLGMATSCGEVEVYAEVFIVKE